jgi:MFS family permease
MDVTIVNVALPTIQEELRAPLAGLQWIIDTYTLVVASFMMLSGSTADRFGRRKVFQIGLSVFTTGSLLCSLAGTIEQLIEFQALQGGDNGMRRGGAGSGCCIGFVVGASKHRKSAPT